MATGAGAGGVAGTVAVEIYYSSSAGDGASASDGRAAVTSAGTSPGIGAKVGASVPVFRSGTGAAVCADDVHGAVADAGSDAWDDTEAGTTTASEAGRAGKQTRASKK